MSSKKNDGIPTPKVDSDIHTLCALGDVSGLKSLIKKNGSDEINLPDSMKYVKTLPPPLTSTHTYALTHTYPFTHQTNTTVSNVKKW